MIKPSLHQEECVEVKKLMDAFVEEVVHLGRHIMLSLLVRLFTIKMPLNSLGGRITYKYFF